MRTTTIYEASPLAADDLAFLPEDLRRLIDVLPEGAVIAGGALTDAVRNLPIKDVDVFFTEEVARQTLRKTLKDMGYKVAPNSPPGCQNLQRDGHLEVQLVNISRDYDEVADILDGFDFTACQLAVTGGQRLYYGPMTICDIIEGVINIHRLETDYPDVVERRVHRYMEKGYRLSDRARATVGSIGVEV